MSEPNLLGKNVIDVGEIGNASTGDILFDGGRKINENSNQIYNTFGDQRLENSINQNLHATGYFQKTPSTGWGPAVKLGEQRDIDTSAGPIRCVIQKGKLGEGVVFINSNGSLSQTNYFEIQVIDSFVSVPTGNLRITAPYSKVTVWCISDSNGISRWDYSVESMFGRKNIPLDRSFSLSSTLRDIQIAHTDDYQVMKLLATCMSADGRKSKTSEILLFIDKINRNVISTEYAVIRTGNSSEEDEIYNMTFSINPAGYVIATASSITASMTLALKVIETQTFGVST